MKIQRKPAKLEVKRETLQVIQQANSVVGAENSAGSECGPQSCNLTLCETRFQ